MVYRDIAPVHTLAAQGFVLKNKMDALPHHPHSPDLQIEVYQEEI
jgi:hypothetical protein